MEFETFVYIKLRNVFSSNKAIVNDDIMKTKLGFRCVRMCVHYCLIAPCQGLRVGQNVFAIYDKKCDFCETS